MWAFLLVLSFLVFLMSSPVLFDQEKTLSSLTPNVKPPDELIEPVYLRMRSFDRKKKEGLDEKNILEPFFQHLKQFVNDTSFDYLRFDAEQNSLSKELSNKASQIRHSAPQIRILNQLSFCKHVLEAMKRSAKKLKHYGASDSHANIWLFKIIELNVRLLALHNSQGKLDAQIPGYLDTLLRFNKSIYFWRLIFKKLKDVPEQIWLSFENEAALAQKTTEFLFAQVHVPKLIMRWK